MPASGTDCPLNVTHGVDLPLPNCRGRGQGAPAPSGKWEAQRKGQAQRDQGEETVREGVLSFWGVQPEPNVEVHAYGQDSTERNQAPPVTSGAPSVQSSSTRRKWDLSGDDRKSGLSGAARTVVVDCRPSADRNDAGSGE